MERRSAERCDQFALWIHRKFMMDCGKVTGEGRAMRDRFSSATIYGRSVFYLKNNELESIAE
jgi:hypothetical protein